MRFRQTCLLNLRFELERVREIAAGKQMREPIDDARRKIERFTHLARRAAPAIGDHVCGHGRAVFSVPAINFLDHRFATVAAGKIEIDIGPAFAALVEETFENQMIFHRIHRRDPQAITNRAIGGAATALDHDVVFATEIDDVPHDQEISRETELDYQREFFLDLAFHLRADRRVTLLRAEPDNGAQKRIHRVTGRHRIRWKFVTEILQRKRELLAQA